MNIIGFLLLHNMLGVMGSGKVVGFSSYSSYWQPVEHATSEEVLWKAAFDKQSINQHD